MTPQEIEALFTRSSGDYVFARWGRPLAPVVFGVEDETLQVVKGALEAVCAMAGHQMAETDPELGSNLMFFFFREWDELPEVPNLDQLVPDLVPLVARLKSVDANQYRIFRFDEAGAIKAAFVFLRMDKVLSSLPAEALALGQVAQTMLLWSDEAFKSRPVLAQAKGHMLLHPEIGAVIRAAYDPVMPAVAQDASHALRLFARASAGNSAN
ncbi:MAG: hypothetical protein VX378_02670 [Pseudomonadota bacterium]|nr:hypothetical protein [Pseudomonadota bacterium]MEE3069980.1 hypothetical protein [Pseudomonadota bacterium]